MTNTTKNGTQAVSQRPVIDEDTPDQLMAKVEADGLDLLGPGGVLTELTELPQV